MKQKAFITIIFMLVMLSSLYAQSEDDFQVRQNPDNTLTITGYTGAEKNVIIPETLYGLKVTVIGNNAFQNKGLTSIEIPGMITIQDGHPFNGKYYGAFVNNSQLTRINLGEGLQSVGAYAFSNCPNLTEIVIPNSVTIIGAGAFENINWGDIGKGRIYKVTFGNRLQIIGQNSFKNNAITELDLPSSVREIGASAFRNNEIVELNLPSSIRTIKTGAFANNRIQSVIIPNGVTEIDNFNGEYLGAFANNPITTVVIPASLANGGIDSYRSPTFGNINGSTITQITIPARMDENTLRGIFEAAFVNFWVSQNRVGGTYVKRGPIWSRE